MFERERINIIHLIDRVSREGTIIGCDETGISVLGDDGGMLFCITSKSSVFPATLNYFKACKENNKPYDPVELAAQLNNVSREHVTEVINDLIAKGTIHCSEEEALSRQCAFQGRKN